MTIRPDPKPVPENPKPRTGLARMSPERKEKRARMRNRKANNPTKYCADPKHRLCTKDAVHFGRCGEHARKHLDDLWGAKVRTGRCEIRALHQQYGLDDCRGPNNACHVVRRDYYHTRWDVRNGLSGCYGVNFWTEFHGLEWRAICVEAIGEEQVAALERINMEKRMLKVDYDYWHAELGCSCGPVR